MRLTIQSRSVKGGCVCSVAIVSEKFGELVSPYTKSELVQILLPSNEIKDVSDSIDIENVKINLKTRLVKVNNNDVHFTPLEFKLLSILAERRGEVQSRGTLLKDVWNMNPNNKTRTVDTHIKRVRNKLGTAFIHTISGVGYVIR